ncbi:hypothetical protein J6U76_03310 [bacterium]|nr:hypothetical protein [bacterium]
MKKVVLSLVLLAVVFLAGCADVSIAKNSSFRTMPCDGNQSIGLYAYRSGLYFLPTYPLWTEGGREVNFNETLADLTAQAKGQGAGSLNTVVAQEESTWLPFTFVLWYKKATVSATASK